MSTTVTAKGQVTIPKAVRDLLGIAPGSKVDFRQTADGKVEIVKAENTKKKPSSFEAFLGHAIGKGPELSTDEIMEMSRGEV